jgi:hypothetical protein
MSATSLLEEALGVTAPDVPSPGDDVMGLPLLQAGDGGGSSVAMDGVTSGGSGGGGGGGSGGGFGGGGGGGGMGDSLVSIGSLEGLDLTALAPDDGSGVATGSVCSLLLVGTPLPPRGMLESPPTLPRGRPCHHFVTLLSPLPAGALAKWCWASVWGSVRAPSSFCTHRTPLTRAQHPSVADTCSRTIMTAH